MARFTALLPGSDPLEQGWRPSCRDTGLAVSNEWTGGMSRRAETIAISHFAVALLAGTMLAGIPDPALAQNAVAPAAAQPTPAAPPTATPAPPPAPAPVENTVIRTISVVGAQRLEANTILSYIQLRPGQVYTAVAADQALKDLAATELFSDVRIENNSGDVVITVAENPVINRIILEGNKRIKDDKITKEIKLAPRQIFTRSKVRADVSRIIELYKRQGRFAATVEPKMVQLSQNRVDIVFEISEGPKSKVRAINIIGNEQFSDGKLKGEMLTKEASLTKILSGGTSYDPDKMAYDQQKLRQFYLTQGYADFRVVSAVAELTPDKKDFIITYVVEEGKRYKFGDVKVQSQIRDFDSKAMTTRLPMKTGDWYNAKMVEDTVDGLTETAGTFGYAFADVKPQFHRNPETLTMDVTFAIGESPRTYVERIDVNGNTLTQDKIVRREFRVAEGDAFNSLGVKRTTNRINSLGYFQENFEVTQVDGSAPDRIILDANVQEQATGQLTLSAGFSSLESFIFQGSIQQRNFRGRGQTVGLSANYSKYDKSGQVSFTEPYLFDKNISGGIDIYRRDYNNGYFSSATATYQQSTTGAQFRIGIPLSEYTSLLGTYTLNFDNVTLDKASYYTTDITGAQTCNPLLAGRYLCDSVGSTTTSMIGGTLVYQNLDNALHPTRGRVANSTLEIAGLGGTKHFIRIRNQAAEYWPVGHGFIFSIRAETGFIKGFGKNGPSSNEVLLTDRFFLGQPELRGFDYRGVGPRVIRRFYGTPGDESTLTGINDKNSSDDSLGGEGYYLGKFELEIPLGSGAHELGLRPSIFMDVGSVFGIKAPSLNVFPTGGFIPTRDTSGHALYTQIDTATTNTDGTCAITAVSTVTTSVNPHPPACLASPFNNTPIGQTLPAFREQFYGNSPMPRLSIGAGVNWNSPFGPLRIDFAYPLLKQKGDQTKLFSFNVGTQF
jgi:outer membrane protein insertion porin family